MFLDCLHAARVGFPSLATFSEITLRANPAPWGGYIQTDPPSGKALSTTFLISSPGWTAEADGLPLSYSFGFQTSPSAPLLSLASMNLRSYTSSYLPAGRNYLNYSIALEATAMDIYTSTANCMGKVKVDANPTVDITVVLNTSLTTAFSSSDGDLIFRTVNNVSINSTYLTDL